MTGDVARIAAIAGVARSQSRLAAVQALYQMDLSGIDLNEVIQQFLARRFGTDAEVDDVREADPAFFAEIVRGVVDKQREIDPPLDAQLAAGWRLNRIDSTVRAVLRSAMYELLHRLDVPARVIITEYVEVAGAFFSEDEPKVVNAVLDKLARKHRPKEFGLRG